MTDELKQQVAFAAMGKQVLDNIAYKQVIMERKAYIFDVFCNTKQDQSDVREEAWRTMKNMNALEDSLQEILTTGKIAEIDLKEEQNDDR